MRMRAWLIGCWALMAPALVLADWQVDPAVSTIHYLTTKNGQVVEPNRFERFSGQLTDAGAFTVRIDLASVDTAIAIRDRRVREILFEVTRFPEAVITADLDLTALPDKAGETARLKVPMQLTLHGVTEALRVDVDVTRLTGGDLGVQARTPVLVDAGDFGLSEGLTRLRDIARLESITSVVPVGFALRLRAAE